MRKPLLRAVTRPLKKTKDYSHLSDDEIQEILRQSHERTLKQMMWDDPKEFVEITIQGMCLKHRRESVKHRE